MDALLVTHGESDPSYVFPLRDGRCTHAANAVAGSVGNNVFAYLGIDQEVCLIRTIGKVAECPMFEMDIGHEVKVVATRLAISRHISDGLAKPLSSWERQESNEPMCRSNRNTSRRVYW